jgi:hypothetical protein
MQQLHHPSRPTEDIIVVVQAVPHDALVNLLDVRVFPVQVGIEMCQEAVVLVAAVEVDGALVVEGLIVRDHCAAVRDHLFVAWLRGLWYNNRELITALMCVDSVTKSRNSTGYA